MLAHKWRDGRCLVLLAFAGIIADGTGGATSLTKNGAVRAAGAGCRVPSLYNNSNSAFAVGATIISYGNEFELIPVPEPSTGIAAGLALTTLLFTQCQRFKNLISRT